MPLDSAQKQTIELVEYMDEEVVTYYDLKRKYYVRKKNLDIKTQLLNALLNEMKKLKMNLKECEQKILIKINILKEIILNKSVLDSMEEEYNKLKMKYIPENNIIEYLIKEKGIQNIEEMENL